MINSLFIKNFKSIKTINLELAGLNLLFGMNGMGKSSTIQSLLLCRQSYWRSGRNGIESLYPNGDLIKLGGASEILNRKAEDDMIEFIIEEDEKEMDLSFVCKNNRYAAVIEKREGSVDNIDSCLFSNGFVYLAAEHLGPQKKYSYSGWDDRGINKYGTHGEFTVPFLATRGVKHISESVRSDMASSGRLIDNVSAWMNGISPGVRINTELISQDLEAKLRISYNEGDIVSDDYSPVNVGFGIPYVLPVITALLAADKGDLVIIENPESHLHPKGQSVLARLMAYAAAGGVQIICESHSDHIINGVRVAVKDEVIANDNVSVYYYSKNTRQDTQSTRINIDSNGNLDNYPQGLLDEWGNLMAQLI